MFRSKPRAIAFARWPVAPRPAGRPGGPRGGRVSGVDSQDKKEARGQRLDKAAAGQFDQDFAGAGGVINSLPVGRFRTLERGTDKDYCGQAMKWITQMASEASRSSIFRGLMLLAGCLMMSGCAALVPAGSVISPLLGPAPPLQVTENTSVSLGRDNFVLVKTNVVGRSRGFSLLGFITIWPATLTKAMNRMYASAQMRPGESQTLAHFAVERTGSYWILYGIPRVEVRADVVQFVPEVKTPKREKPKPAPTQPPDGS